MAEMAVQKKTHEICPCRFHDLPFNIDGLVKSPKSAFFVIPAKAGIQYFNGLTKYLDPVFQRGDDFLKPSTLVDPNKPQLRGK